MSTLFIANRFLDINSVTFFVGKEDYTKPATTKDERVQFIPDGRTASTLFYYNAGLLLSLRVGDFIWGPKVEIPNTVVELLGLESGTTRLVTLFGTSSRVLRMPTSTSEEIGTVYRAVGDEALKEYINELGLNTFLLEKLINRSFIYQ